MDADLTRWINGFAGLNPALDATLLAITNFGVPLIVACVALQWFARSDRLHVRHAAVSAGVAFVLGLALNQLILLMVHRLRPYDAGVTHLLLPPSADWSFPSDHATASVAIVAVFLMQRLPRRTLALAVLTTLICLSRVFVGTHYVSDIIGGAATGIVAALITKFAYREGSRLDRRVTAIF